MNQACIDDWLRLPGISIHQARSLARVSRDGNAITLSSKMWQQRLVFPVHRLQPLEPILHF